MKATVIYDLWQLQCCGESFRIGDVVTWTVDRPRRAAAKVYRSIAPADELWFEDHHHDQKVGLHALTGTVDTIAGLKSKLVRRVNPRTGDRVWIGKGNGSDFRLADVDAATGWELDDDPLPEDSKVHYSMTAYVVRLTDVSIAG